jgi:Spy/CpxP family protein refolding chaperone
MYKKFLWIVTFAFSLVLSQACLADSMCGGGLKQMVESLKLDDAQKAKIKPILEQLKSTVKDSWTQMKDLDTQINQQVSSATMDQTMVNGLVDKKTKLIGDMMKAKLMAKNQILGILNDKQKTEIQTKMKNLEEKIAAKFKSCHDQD